MECHVASNADDIFLLSVPYFDHPCSSERCCSDQCYVAMSKPMLLGCLSCNNGYFPLVCKLSMKSFDFCLGSIRLSWYFWFWFTGLVFRRCTSCLAQQFKSKCLWFVVQVFCRLNVFFCCSSHSYTAVKCCMSDSDHSDIIIYYVSRCRYMNPLMEFCSNIMCIFITIYIDAVC